MNSRRLWELAPKAQVLEGLGIFCRDILTFRVREMASPAVRVKGRMSLRNGMWHGLRNDIIMRNVKYGKWRKEIN